MALLANSRIFSKVFVHDDQAKCEGKDKNSMKHHVPTTATLQIKASPTDEIAKIEQPSLPVNGLIMHSLTKLVLVQSSF